MKASVCLTIVAIAATQLVDAGHHHSGGSFVENERTAPEAIEESERSITCPHGFKQHGKQCIRTVSVHPTAHCPLGFIRSVEDENVCAKFFDKVFECPSNFVREQGACVRARQIEPLVKCPHGFTIMSDGRQCSRNVPEPKSLFCPPGAVHRGEICLRKRPVEPEFVCPPRFTRVEGHRCKIVETFDCTPEIHVGREVVETHNHHKHLRLLGERSKKTSVVMSKELPPHEKESVVQKTCKRIRLESAHKICPNGSFHHGKECVVEEEVPFHERHGGFREEIVKAEFVCTEGHFSTSLLGHFHCLINEEAPVKGFCPDHSEPFGHRCARFRPFILNCPADHKLEDGHCLKTIVVPPILEFNVRFKCQGKDCDHHHQPSSSKHHK